MIGSYYKNKTKIPIDPSILKLPEEGMMIDITNSIVPDVLDYYSITPIGRIYHKYLGRFLKPGISGSGYLFVELSTMKGPKPIQLHRLVMLSFNYIPGCENLQVNHIDGNKHNNDLRNLEWCSCSYNILHAYSNGLHQKSSAIIDENIAKKICDLLKLNKFTNNEIASIVGEGTTANIVDNIKKKESWKEISSDYEFISRKRKLFSDDDIHRICRYFQNNPKDPSMNNKDYCFITLLSLGYDTTYSNIDSIRHIYDRKHYINISQYYNY